MSKITHARPPRIKITQAQMSIAHPSHAPSTCATILTTRNIQLRSGKGEAQLEAALPEQVVRFCQIAHDRMALGNYEGARPYLVAAREQVDTPPPVLLRLQGVCAAGLQNFGEAIPLLESSLDAFRLAEDVTGEATVAGDLAAVLQRQGNLSRANIRITWALDHAKHVDSLQHTWLLNIAASIVALQGGLNDALRYLEMARSLTSGAFSTWIDLHAATILDQLNRPAEAAAYLDANHHPLAAGDVVTEPLIAYARAWHFLLQGDLTTAYSNCQKVLQHTSLDQHPLIACSATATLGILNREMGFYDRAEELLLQAKGAMQAHHDLAAVLGVSWHQVVLAKQRDNEKSAMIQLEDVLQKMQENGYGTTLLWQPQRFAKLCQWAADEQKNPHAEWLLQHTLAPWIDRASGIDESLPSDPTLRMLTNREYDVCTTLAQGLSDREIADKLGISERTVQNHLQNIYTKLNVRTRSAVVGIVLAQEKAWEVHA